MMLYKLLQHGRFGAPVQVIVLGGEGEIGGRIRRLGVDVQTLGMRPGVPNPFVLVKLIRILRRNRPDVLSTWMYHADLLGGLAGRMLRIPVVWGVRNSTLDVHASKPATRLVMRLCAGLSHFVPHRIITCADRARDVHVNLGYKESIFDVIPNGFELSDFFPSTDARSSVRKEIGVSEDTLLVGLVGRFDPQKNLEGFIEAAGQTIKVIPSVKFVMVGRGIESTNESLKSAMRQSGAEESILMLGRREDVSRLMASFDVLVSSSSFGEAFPNVIGEAMACGVPCVVTDVGDSANIVGSTGVVVRPHDVSGLSRGTIYLLTLPAEERRKLSAECRQRVRSAYDIADIAAQYRHAFTAVATERYAGRR